jgi:hypothetical protein
VAAPLAALNTARATKAGDPRDRARGAAVSLVYLHRSETSDALIIT